MTKRPSGGRRRIDHIECELDGETVKRRAERYAAAKRSQGFLARVHPRIVRAEGLSARIYVVVVEEPAK